MTNALRAVCAALLALLCVPANADELRPAVIELTEREPGRWVMEWKMPVAATRGQSAAPNAQPVLPDACETLSPPVQRAASLALLGRVELRCDGAMAVIGCHVCLM